MVVQLGIGAIQAEVSIQRPCSGRVHTIGRLSESNQSSIIELPFSYFESRHS